ncbi:MSCRAMM family protein [Edaphobacter dinghuensis]|uniref:Carboxypeptidase family protein n=1 Tax=Edaphobacter dinghuensis TaxID=1560005 RepID=A0A917HQJ4_9BACT|nr:hypothetical protein [Edaphobacter dinghuensis]GGG86549.1 hypothetical protein GCM10011585_33120 [Edaphobacter dinghuensis]
MLLSRFFASAAFLSCTLLQAQAPGRTHDSSLIGSLLASDDSTIQGHVMAYRIEARHGRMMPTPQCSTNTDAQGAFECVHLEPGSYILIASALRRSSSITRAQSGSVAPTRLPLFEVYPTNTDLDANNLVKLGSGETQSIQVQIQEDPGSDFQVKSAAGQARDKALQVSALGEDFAVSTNVRISADSKSGNYSVKGLVPGEYRLTELWSQNGVTHQGAAFISVGQLTSGQAVITEVKPYNVAGKIRYPDSASHGTVEVVLESAATFDAHRYAAAVQPDGSFSLAGVLSGKYYISLSPGSGLYATDILVSGRSVGGTLLTLDDLHSNSPLTLVTGAAYGSITGTLKLGDSAQQGASVVVESISSHTSQLVPVDSQGMFKADKLAPGEYLIYGWADVRQVPYDSSSFLRRYENKAIHVELENGSQENGLEIECNEIGS